MKFKLGAVIPTVQYGNLQPEIELEGDDFAAMNEEATGYIKGIWDRFGEKPLKDATAATIPRTVNFVEVTTFTGDKIMYDPVGHVYLSMKGEVLLSGSKYAKQFEKPFDSGAMAARTAKSWNVDPAELEALWKLNGKISTEYGSSIHAALEAYHRYGKMGEAIQAMKVAKGEADAVNYALPKNPHVRAAVVSFVEQFGFDAMAEVFVSDVPNKRVGQIDRLAIIDAEKKICRVGDFKSNNELTKEKITCYQHQLSFYAHILIAHGWTVEGLDIYHLADGVWTHVPLEVKELAA